ncbi:unnamed protein product [Litomosoides sigmodontis]|uniref:Apple domain-containing protein n=1 Tax=Litomosoides sigmodontis TaxID=42156 RepID=A0A3P6SNJ8_LITSI|nr:unnamed protein product [Litomosoides sigmodontis]
MSWTIFAKLLPNALGPPRGGFQRAIIDEVLVDDSNGLAGEITQLRNDIDAYDDKFVDLVGENPLFIPKLYREEKEERKVTKQSTTAAARATSNPPTSLIALEGSAKLIGRTLTPTQRTTHLPSFPRATIGSLAPQSHQRKKVPSQPPRTVSHQSFPTSAPFRCINVVITPFIFNGFRLKTNPQLSLFVPQLPQFANQPQHSIRPISARPTDRTPLITPSVQRPQPSSSIGFPPPSHSNSNSLRVGVCHASIFYISTPMQNPGRHSFTHFAITVSTDQCARTCHEFNCVIAHYDPATGRCEFNPSTALAIRKGQCPPWPATHYKNGVKTNVPLRIFCVQCRRSFRRGQANKQGNRFRTTVLKALYTGRLPRPVYSSGVARMRSVLSKQSDVIIGSSFRNIAWELERGHDGTVSSSAGKERFISDSNHHRDRSGMEMEVRAIASRK